MNECDRAQEGIKIIQGAIIDLLRRYPDGLTNAVITRELGLESDQNGKQKNYLAWSVLGILMGKGQITRHGTLYKLDS